MTRIALLMALLTAAPACKSGTTGGLESRQNETRQNDRSDGTRDESRAAASTKPSDERDAGEEGQPETVDAKPAPETPPVSETCRARAAEIAHPRPDLQGPVIDLTVGRGSVCAEVVHTNPQRSWGLMKRMSMPDDHAMLFVFSREEPLSFWMKNTLIPLSIAYADKDGVIVSIHDMQPQDLTSIPSAAPAMYALEVNQGWFDKHRVKPGDRLEFALPAEIKTGVEQRER